MRRFIAVFLTVCTLLLLCACQGAPPAEKPSKEEGKTPVSTPETGHETSEGTVAVYSVYDYDALDLFLKSPDLETLGRSAEDSVLISGAGESYHWLGRPYVLEEKFFSFVSQSDAVSDFLEKHGVEETVLNRALFRAPYMPLCLWVRTDKSTAFFTINELESDRGFIYRFYKEDEFYDKYRGVDASLKALTDHSYLNLSNKVRLYQNVVIDLPFLKIWEQFGAKIERGDVYDTVSFSGVRYRFSAEKRELFLENSTDNLFELSGGGPYFFKTIEGDLLVDSEFLCAVLSLVCRVKVVWDRQQQSACVETAEQKETVGEYTYTYQIRNGAATILECRWGDYYYKENEVSIVVPETLGGYPVREIDGGDTFYQSPMKSVVLPQSLEVLGPCFYRCYNLAEIEIPKNVSIIDASIYRCGVQSISVHPENEHFVAVDGVLYDKEQTRLVYYPESKLGDEFTIPQTVKKVDASAFGYLTHVKRLTIGEAVTEFPDYNMFHFPDILLRVKKGSAAEEYVKKFPEIKYELY